MLEYPTPLTAPHLLDQVARFARERSGEPALVFVARGRPDCALTWGELDAVVRRLGGHFQELGMAPGDTVLVLASSPGDQILAFLGAMACGGVPTILSFPSVKQSESRFLEMLGSMVASSQARWIVA